MLHIDYPYASSRGMRPLFTGLIAGALLLAGLAAPAQAGRNVAEWDVELAEIRTLLHTSEYEKAEKECRGLLKDFDYWIMDGSAVNRLIGQAFAFRAVATMGQGESRLAAWDFSVAQAFYPAILPEHLSVMGPAGEELLRYLTQSDGAIEANAQAAGFDSKTCEELTSPKLKNRSHPKIPFAIREMLHVDKEIVIVGVNVNENGELLSFSLPKTPRFPTMAANVAESLRDVRFEPARCDGEAVSFRYNLSTSMSMETR